VSSRSSHHLYFHPPHLAKAAHEALECEEEEIPPGEFEDTWSWLRNELDAERVRQACDHLKFWMLANLIPCSFRSSMLSRLCSLLSAPPRVPASPLFFSLLSDLFPYVRAYVKRPRTHPDYDPSTLYIPKSEFARLTPAQQQYWLIKSKNWDSLVFFRVGKFFELYNKDADVAHRLFDLKLVVKPTRYVLCSIAS